MGIFYSKQVTSVLEYHESNNQFLKKPIQWVIKSCFKIISFSISENNFEQSNPSIWVYSKHSDPVDLLGCERQHCGAVSTDRCNTCFKTLGGCFASSVYIRCAYLTSSRVDSCRTRLVVGPAGPAARPSSISRSVVPRSLATSSRLA